MRAHWVCTTVAGCNKQRCGCRGRRMPVAIKRRSCGKVLLFEDVVQPPRLAEERVRLRDLSLLVGVAVHLEGCLRFGEGLAKAGRKGRKEEGEPQTSPYSFVSQMSKSGRRLPSCSLQRTTGCIVPDAPLKKTDALGSRFVALVFSRN